MPTEFNPKQREAIEHVHGPMLVVAGAGTGKTSVLVERIARLIADGHACAGEVLAITYTDNAAAEMRERVQRRLRELDASLAGDLNAITFHAYGNKLLNEHGQGFGVLDEKDLWVYLRQRLEELELQHYTRAVNPAHFLDALLEFFSRCHDELVDAADYERYIEQVCAGESAPPRVLRTKDNKELGRDEMLSRCREIARVYRRVEQMLREENLGTFGHMLLRAVQLLQSDAQVLAAERAKARFVLIDEFQDTNLAQIEMAQLLAAPDNNIFAVGDPDQAIYRFRGASSAAFAEFVKRFPQSKGVVLAENQRSLSPVLHCSYGVISHNPAVHCVAGASGERFERQSLESAREARARKAGVSLSPPPVEVGLCESSDQEAAEVARAIAKLLEEPESEDKGLQLAAVPGQLSLLEPPSRPARPPRVAVLYRQHGHRDETIRALAARGIHFSVRGMNALETPEVRDLLACLRVVGRSDAESLFRVSALPQFGLDPQRVRRELAAAGKQALFTAVLEQVPGGERVLSALDHAREEVRAAGMQVLTAIKITRRLFGLAPSEAGNAFEEFVREWRKRPIARKGGLADLLSYLDYFPEAGGIIELPMAAGETDPNVVRLMTAHIAKGLEFDHVFVLRLNPSSFPTVYREKLFEFPAALRKSIAAEGDSGEIHKEEERRLFYVAMTRARDSLTLLGRPSRNKPERPYGTFLRELTDTRATRAYWRLRPPVPHTVDLQAAAAPSPGLGEWFLLPPSARMQDPVLSATAVESYETCPLQFKLERDWNVPGRVAAAMQYGNVVHTVLKDFYQAVLQGRPRTREELLQSFREALADIYFEDSLQRRLYEKQGLDQLGAFFEQQQQNAPDVLDAERGFELPIGEVRVRGRVDRLDRIAGDRVSIVDYKTGSAQDKKDADKSLQLSIYAMAARRKWNLVPERLVIYNLEDNSEVVTQRDDADLREVELRVQEVAANIAQGNFEPTPGYHCRFCNYRQLCPATEQRIPQVAHTASTVN